MRDLGRSVLDHWHLDPSFAYLNHGTVGATPKRVLEAQRSWSERIERHPAEFMLRRLANPMAIEWAGQEPPAMRQAAATAAHFVGADPAGVVLVDNITTGANAVLRSLELAPDDIVAVTNLGYGGITRAARFVTERSGATGRPSAARRRSGPTCTKHAGLVPTISRSTGTRRSTRRNR